MFENHESHPPPTPCLFLTLFTSQVIYMEKEFAPMNRPQFFPLLLGLTITYQHSWVHSARPKPGESVPSETVPNAPVTIQHLFHRWSVWGFLLSVPLGFARFVYIHFTPSQRQNLPTSLFICVDLVFFFFFSPYGSEAGAACLGCLSCTMALAQFQFIKSLEPYFFFSFMVPRD